MGQGIEQSWHGSWALRGTFPGVLLAALWSHGSCTPEGQMVSAAISVNSIKEFCSWGGPLEWSNGFNLYFSRCFHSFPTRAV